MAKRKNQNGSDPVGINTEDQPTSEDSKVGVPPYDGARWITIRQAAEMANVTGQTVRNAYKDHAAFNVAGVTEADPTSPRWFETKMVDSFDNVTDFNVIYLDQAAVQDWIAARAAKPAHGGMHSGAKRYIVRLTDAQVAALPVILFDDGQELPAVRLADETLIRLEKPPVGTRKPKNASASTAETSDGDPVGSDVPPTDFNGHAQTADLFDVELTEV